MKKPEILCHDSALASFKRYPPGSKERAKALGISLWLTYGRVDSTLKEWEETERLAEEEEVWKPLGLKSLDDLILQITGKSRTAVRKELGKRGRPSVLKQRGQSSPGPQKACDTRIKWGTVEHWLARLDRDAKDDPEFAELKRRYDAGEFASVRQMGIAAGYVKEQTELQKMKLAWKKADKQQRSEFMKWLRTDEAK